MPRQGHQLPTQNEFPDVRLHHPDLLRFNEAIDQIMTESLSRFVERFNLSGRQIIRTLVNDVRDPLLAMHDSAKILLAKDKIDGEDAQLVSQIVTTSSRINGFVSDVIEAVGIPLGREGSISSATIDIGTSTQKAAKEIQAAHPKTENPR
jgi:hypothetical protein